ncbi:hypothetical protein ACP70R_047251 [Stipagrostis hirtigluma subsp. patula]
MASSSSSSSSAAAAEPPLPWLILGRVARVPHSGHPTLTVAQPPRVSTLTVSRTHHPKPADADRHPYVVAADDAAGFLVHVSASPYIGFDLGRNPPGILLVVPACDFAQLDEPAPRGTATRVPDRDRPRQPGVSSIKNLGIVSRPGSGGADYVVAELRFEDHDRASLLSFRTDDDEWVERPLQVRDYSPSGPAGRRWTWSSDDVIPHNGWLWWVDLVEGILRCNPFAAEPELWYVSLPEAATGLTAQYTRDPPQNIESRRMVRVSTGNVRFVDIAPARIDDERPGEKRVVIWKLVPGPDCRTFWEQQCETRLARIWASSRYKEIGLPEQVPELALVHPGRPDVVYFFLEQHLFGVDVSQSTVVDFAREPGLVEVIPGPVRPPPISWRHVLAWVMPPSLSDELEEKRNLALQGSVRIKRRSLTYIGA